MARAKVSILGSGRTGGTMALFIAQRNLADVVLYDILPGFPQGLALDLTQAGALLRYDARITGTNDLADTANSDIIINTAGSPRKPGQSREDMALATAKIVRELAARCGELSPQAVYIGFTNPMDAMTQIAFETLGFPRERVVGQGGVLDSARFRTFIAEALNVPVKDVQAMVLGGHTETDMIPLVRDARVQRVPLTGLLSPERIDEVVRRTRNGGKEIVELMKTGSAFNAPAAAAVEMVEAILGGSSVARSCSAYLDGEYGIRGTFVGVPVVLGLGGIVEIFERDLEPLELQALQRAAEATRQLVESVKSKEAKA